MMHSAPQPSGSTSNASDLRRIFVRRVHELIRLGYERLTPATHVKEQEPAITGFLVQVIDDVLSERAKAWMKFFSVHDDPPVNVNDGRRKGKRRKRVDLRIDSAHFTPRAHYRFEAKRLGKGHPVSQYLGVEGLGCFLRGDYAKEEDEAGMLGYVQSDNLALWGQRIGDKLTSATVAYALDRTVGFSAHSTPLAGALTIYRSQHDRVTVGRSIVIMHVLLRFF